MLFIITTNKHKENYTTTRDFWYIRNMWRCMSRIYGLRQFLPSDIKER